MSGNVPQEVRSAFEAPAPAFAEPSASAQAGQPSAILDYMREIFTAFQAEIATLRASVNDLDAKLQTVKVGPKGSDGVPGSAGKDGKDGKSVTTEEVARIVQDTVNKDSERFKGANGRNGKDGKDGDVLGKEWIDLLNRKMAGFEDNFERRMQDYDSRLSRMAFDIEGIFMRLGQDKQELIDRVYQTINSRMNELHVDVDVAKETYENHFNAARKRLEEKIIPEAIAEVKWQVGAVVRSGDTFVIKTSGRQLDSMLEDYVAEILKSKVEGFVAESVEKLKLKPVQQRVASTEIPGPRG